jgi:hypothetical protein
MRANKKCAKKSQFSPPKAEFRFQIDGRGTFDCGFRLAFGEVSLKAEF